MGNNFRQDEWDEFSDQMSKHFLQYVIPQYGDNEGNEEAKSYDAADCLHHVKRYAGRAKARVRGDKEALRDCIKIGHYAAMLYKRMKEELNEPDVY
jgi:hypothetical protein